MDDPTSTATKTHSDPKDLVIAMMIKIFGEDRIADPEIFPRMFESQVKMARYQIFLDENPV